jgi:hypothetical protein
MAISTSGMAISTSEMAIIASRLVVSTIRMAVIASALEVTAIPLEVTAIPLEVIAIPLAMIAIRTDVTASALEITASAAAITAVEMRVIGWLSGLVLTRWSAAFQPATISAPLAGLGEALVARFALLTIESRQGATSPRSGTWDIADYQTSRPTRAPVSTSE